MTSMNEHLVRATIDARLAKAHERHLGRQAEREKRTERRRHRRWRWWAAPRRRAAVGRLALAPAVPVCGPSLELDRMLEDAAHRVAEQGTSSERPLLQAMSDVAAQSAPGAAAALVDWAGTEASRLRAFGVLHSHILNALGSHEHAWLLDLVDNGHEHSGRVA